MWPEGLPLVTNVAKLLNIISFIGQIKLLSKSLKMQSWAWGLEHLPPDAKPSPLKGPIKAERGTNWAWLTKTSTFFCQKQVTFRPAKLEQIVQTLYVEALKQFSKLVFSKLHQSSFLTTSHLCSGLELTSSLPHLGSTEPGFGLRSQISLP